VESLGLDEKEIFNAYNEIPSIRDKDQFLIPFIDVINDPEFKTGTLDADQKLLKSIIVFACLMEGLSSTSASPRSWRLVARTR
jgi:ribonucleoside-diphosphate reductase beta chain